MLTEGFASRLRLKMRERQLTQQQLADALYVSRQTVTRWLSSTVPIARHLSALANLLDASPQWLLTGDEAARGVAAGRLLDHMAYGFEYLRALGKEQGRFNPAFDIYQDILQSSLRNAHFAREKLRQLSAEWQRRVEEISEGAKKRPLQKSDMSLVLDRMEIPTVNELLEKVRRLTISPGAKVEFAKAIKVRPQHLSAWLAKRYQPSGETALRMLAWVQAREAQTKRDPGTAETAPGQATQLQGSSYEKPKVRSKSASHKGAKRSKGKRGIR